MSAFYFLYFLILCMNVIVRFLMSLEFRQSQMTNGKYTHQSVESPCCVSEILVDLCHIMYIYIYFFFHKGHFLCRISFHCCLLHLSAQ